MTQITPKMLKTINEKYCMFNAVADEIGEGKFLFSAKDNLTTKDMETCAGSKILKGYRPAFDATAVEKMRSAGGSLIGKTNMDEFGFGTFSVNSGFGIPRNPFDVNRACGGSSGGAACAASVFEDHIALGVSTGGSISCPASFCGVYGLTPTYGRVSRHGLIDYGNSLDKIGVLSQKGKDMGKFLSVIAGKDPRDPISCTQPEYKLAEKKMRSVAIPKDSVEGISKGVMEHFEKSLEMLKGMSIDIEYVDMPSMKYAMPAYYVLATSEASTNLARYCGMRYGQQDGDLALGFDDYFASFRSEYFGKEAKRRILLGTFTRMMGFREKYYSKALKVRESVIADYQRIFKDHDAVVTPTMPFVSPRFDDISKMSPLDSYKADFLTIPANLSGMPHLSVPCGYSDGMPVGLQFVADQWNENVLTTMANVWDSAFTVKRPEVKI